MLATLTLLAVTRMLSGFCLAGVDEQAGWVRPTKRSGVPQIGDVTYRDGALMAPFDRVRFEFERALPDPPHVEDYACDFVRRRPLRVGRLSGAERSAFLDRVAEPSAEPILTGQRSLLIVRGDEITATFAFDRYSSKYEARVDVPGLAGGQPLPCTDLRWRALGRRLVDGGTLRLPATELRARVPFEAAYVCLGLARQLDGRHRPLVVGVHLVPDYEVVVDPTNP